ncbi:MAG TPA: MFS transporter [Herpetosiphonaceae bacterium]|nr:MFS transporter [Herpetosiphonaceae bacterium]
MSTTLLSIVRHTRRLSPIRLPRVRRGETTISVREVRHGMRLGLFEAALAQVFLTIAFGTIATGLALLLGARSFELGVLAALPVIGSLLQFPAAWWVERHGHRRRLAVIGSLGRQLWLVPALLLFLPLPTGVRMALFLGVLAVGHMLLAVANNAWTSWMTDLIPSNVRGRYFGARGAVTGCVAIVLGCGGASLIDYAKSTGLEAPTYAGLLVFTVVAGGLGSWLLARQPEPPKERTTTICLSDLCLMPLRHPSFRKFVGTFSLWNIGLGLGAPFFIAYGLTALNLPLRTLALTETTTALCMMIAQPRWGALADRIGHNRVLRLCMAGVAPTPLLWLLASHDRVWPIFLASAIGGLMWAGIGTGQTSRMMEQAPEEGRAAFFAAFSAMTGLPFMLASMGAGALMSAIGVNPVTVDGLTFHPYLMFFVASATVRLLAVILGWKAV